MDTVQIPDIFLVDDSNTIRVGMVFILESENYTVKEFDKPDLLVEELLSIKKLPRLIISDYDMPGMNGIELVKTLKNSSTLNHLPVIIISSHKDSRIKDQALESGAVDWIDKIAFVKKILPAVHKYILPYY